MSKDKKQIANNNESFFNALSKFIKEYRKISFKSLEEYELTPSEIDILMFLLNNAPELDTAKDISQYKGISKALVCRSVDSLSKKGLVSTAVDKEDRRIVHLALREDASEILHKLKKSKEIFGDMVMEGIKEEDIKIFMRVINTMLDNVNRFKDE